MKKNYIFYFLIIFSLLQGVLDGDDSDFLEDSCPYISPGIQIGYNFDKGFFYGFQISTGIAYFHTSHYIFSPSISYSFKKYFNSKSLFVENVITQSEFLQKMGIVERVKIASKKMNGKDRLNLYTRVQRLIDPSMMGKNFKVIFARNKKCNFSLAFK